MPAMPGTSVFSSFLSVWKTDAISSRNISGRPKLKKAALGLRQNRRRSKRYCRQRRVAPAHSVPGLLGQLKVDLLERGDG